MYKHALFKKHPPRNAQTRLNIKNNRGMHKYTVWKQNAPKCAKHVLNQKAATFANYTFPTKKCRGMYKHTFSNTHTAKCTNLFICSNSPPWQVQTRIFQNRSPLNSETHRFQNKTPRHVQTQILQKNNDWMYTHTHTHTPFSRQQRSDMYKQHKNATECTDAPC